MRATAPLIMLVLAAHLDALPPEALLDGLRLRRFEAIHPVHDVFDLAEALLSADAIDTALESLQRPTIAVLAVLGAAALDAEGGADRAVDDATVRERLVEAGAGDFLLDRLDLELERLRTEFLVIRRPGETASEVPVLLANRLAQRFGNDLPDIPELVAAPSPVPVGTDGDGEAAAREHHAAEIAYATVSQLAELVSGIAAQPARELAKGGLALPDVKRLGEAAGVELERVAPLAAIASKSGLIVREGQEWFETPAGAEWLLDPSGRRWRLLAEVWRAGIAEELLMLAARRGDAVTADAILEDARWFYPAGRKRLIDIAEAAMAEAEVLGVTVDGVPSRAGHLLLAGSVDGAAETMAELFPTQVDQVYVQHDLSIVSPGPLEPAVDAGLRAFADVEGRDLATSYRVTAASVNRALASGRTADSIREFLERVSRTGIPQPLAYLIDESAAKFGSIRVGPAPEIELPAKTVVHADDAQVIATLQVDQALTPVGLIPAGEGRLTSRFAPEIVFWALADAKYPVAAEDAAGEVVRLRRERQATPTTSIPTVDPLIALVDRVRAASGSADEAGWLARQLETAARAKETLTVSVKMPGGIVADYLLAPASVANGRLRARDQKADIERTLPLSAIAGIAPAP
ncbi:helicase-associated domain-containing protein [Agromyces seonyuensis]|uniref:helicase-associated domain-containing protein n=1 Tax=Agromyces seonyuensis TaxID=2662446 RepID=UPI00136664BF|nr:helicase-associated domain-containing protein [Agromyces seonyuensis]